MAFWKIRGSLDILITHFKSIDLIKTFHPFAWHYHVLQYKASLRLVVDVATPLCHSNYIYDTMIAAYLCLFHIIWHFQISPSIEFRHTVNPSQFLFQPSYFENDILPFSLNAHLNVQWSKFGTIQPHIRMNGCVEVSATYWEWIKMLSGQLIYSAFKSLHWADCLCIPTPALNQTSSTHICMTSSFIFLLRWRTELKALLFCNELHCVINSYCYALSLKPHSDLMQRP